MVTAAQERDFAAFPDIVTRRPAGLVKECDQLASARTDTVTVPLRDLGKEERTAVHSTMLNQIRPPFMSDIVGPDLPRVSLQTYLAKPEDRVLVCDNVQRDRYARSFW